MSKINLLSKKIAGFMKEVGLRELIISHPSKTWSSGCSGILSYIPK